MTAASEEASRRSLRHMRSLVGGVLVGFVALFGATTLKLIQDQDRCEEGNEFRSEHLPAAFAEYSELLGERFGIPPEEVETAVTEFNERLARRFPPQDCRLL